MLELKKTSIVQQLYNIMKFESYNIDFHKIVKV